MNQFRGSESHRGDAVIFSKKKIAIFRGSRTSEPDISKTGKLTPIFFVLYPHYIDHSGDFKPTPVKIYGVVFEQSESDPSTYTYLTLLPGGKWPLLNVNCSAAGGLRPPSGSFLPSGKPSGGGPACPDIPKPCVFI